MLPFDCGTMTHATLPTTGCLSEAASRRRRRLRLREAHSSAVHPLASSAARFLHLQEQVCSNFQTVAQLIDKFDARFLSVEQSCSLLMECASSLSAQASIAGGRISALELLSKDKSHAAFPDEALDADDAKILHGSSEYEEQLVEGLEADATYSETEIFPQIDAVVTSDQDFDAVLEDGADVALPDENLDVDNAKIVYDSR